MLLMTQRPLSPALNENDGAQQRYSSRMSKQPPTSNVTVEFEGKKCSATYYTTGRIVIVESAYGRESKQRGGSQPDEVARILLYQLLRAAKSRGTLQAKRKKN
jgi:hypothetical protein